MKRTFFSRYALLIICIVCFLGPFALRGARMSMQRMTNRVKDWLPSDFAETADLEWFGRHFMGEQFVIVTWPGCTEDDPRYQKLVDRIQHQIAPPEHHETRRAGRSLAAMARKPFEELTPDERLALDRQRAGELGDQLGLCTVGDYYENWGQRGEKWLRGDHDLWYFITPKGELYRWAGRSNMLNWLYRTFQRSVLGRTQAEGELVATFGLPPAPEQPNEFHANPELLTARLFKSITTGPDTLEQLSRKDGPLWPRGVDDEIRRRRSPPEGVGASDGRPVRSGRQADLHHADVERAGQTGLAARDRPGTDGAAAGPLAADRDHRLRHFRRGLEAGRTAGGQRGHRRGRPDHAGPPDRAVRRGRHRAVACSWSAASASRACCSSSAA